MRQFNLKEYLENPDITVVTRDGRKVQILKTNALNKNFPIIGTLISDNIEFPWSWTINGKSSLSEKVESDLFFLDEDNEEFIDTYQFNTICHHIEMKMEMFKKEGNKEEQDRWQGMLDWLKSKKDSIIQKQKD